MTPALQWVGEKIKEEYGVQIATVWELGGRYHPSLGGDSRSCSSGRIRS